MGDEYHSLELQELRKIRFLLESILNLKEEQMTTLRGSAEPSPAEAGTHDECFLEQFAPLPREYHCDGEGGIYMDKIKSDEFIWKCPDCGYITHDRGNYTPCKAPIQIKDFIPEPPKADTAERANASEAVSPSITPEDSPRGVYCWRCRKWLYHGKAHIHTPTP